MTSLYKPFVCSICLTKVTDEYGNNAWPINNGRCCDMCNTIVVVKRIMHMQKMETKCQKPN